MSSVALVTGGAVRVGRAITLGLVDAGYDVVVNYHSSEGPARDLAQRVEAQGREALLIQGDVSNPDEVARIGEGVRTRFGRLDLVVNSASSFVPTALLDIDAEEWDHVMGVNLKGPHLIVREVADLLRATGGSVVNITDHMAFEPWVRYAHHSVSKAALMHLTRIMAKALAPDVRVNAIAPGLVLAPEGLSGDELAAEIEATVLKEAGTPDDVVRTVLFLASSPYVTGQVIVVDGGRSLGR